MFDFLKRKCFTIKPNVYANTELLTYLDLYESIGLSKYIFKKMCYTDIYTYDYIRYLTANAITVNKLNALFKKNLCYSNNTFLKTLTYAELGYQYQLDCKIYSPSINNSLKSNIIVLDKAIFK